MMMNYKRITISSFVGAALLFLLAPIFFMGLSTSQDLFLLGHRFLLGWFLLGVSIYLQSIVQLKYTKWLPILLYSMLIYGIFIAIHYLTIFFFPSLEMRKPNGQLPERQEAFFGGFIFVIVGYIYVRQYYHQKRHKEDELHIAKLKNENLQLQLNSLQQQLNPHFFFNSLNTLSELIYIDVEISEVYINELSQVFRYILDMQQETLISLKKELDFITSYFNLLKIRFDNKLNLELNIEKVEAYKIPSLSLLVLFENVIKHNAISETKPLNIELSISDNFLSVKNNKNPLAQLKNPSLGIGLNNLQNRCELLTDKPCKIIDEELFFNVKIPLSKNYEHRIN